MQSHYQREIGHECGAGTTTAGGRTPLGGDRARRQAASGGGRGPAGRPEECGRRPVRPVLTSFVSASAASRS